MEGVKTTHTVTGLYDIIVYAEAADLNAYRALIAKIHAIRGIQRTQTAISV